MTEGSLGLEKEGKSDWRINGVQKARSRGSGKGREGHEQKGREGKIIIEKS